MSPYTSFIHTKSRAEKWWSKGHVTLFKAKDEKYYAIYHAIENGQRYTGRITCLLPIKWDENEWFYIKENDEDAICIENIGGKINIAEQLNYTKGQNGLSVLYNGCDKNTYDNIKFAENGMEIKASSELPSKRVCSLSTTKAMFLIMK